LLINNPGLFLILLPELTVSIRINGRVQALLSFNPEKQGDGFSCSL